MNSEKKTNSSSAASLRRKTVLRTLDNGPTLLDWITDPHFDTKKVERLRTFLTSLHHRPSEGLLVTGDFCEGWNLTQILGILCASYKGPIYFVLGNHDYYGSWIEDQRKEVDKFRKQVSKRDIRFLTLEKEPISLTEKTCLIGHDGWYDGQFGLGKNSRFSMPDMDFRMGIRDITSKLQISTSSYFNLLSRLGKESADHIERLLKAAYRKGFRKMLVLTHVPPFWETALFKRKMSSENSVAFFTNKALGERLEKFAQRNANCDITVLCGHTHSPCTYKRISNLTVKVGYSGLRYEEVFVD